MRIVISNESISNTISDLKEYYDKISDDGCFFAMITTEYDKKGNVTGDIFDVIHYAGTIGYKYINTIVYPNAESQHVVFDDNVKYVVWFCKDVQKMRFNKDPIREKHIWKDVEWGKRAKNYNPKGKDPGNVWIPTEDDGKANITNHILLNNENVIDRIIMMTSCEDDYVILKNEIPKKIELEITRVSKEKECDVSGRVIFGSSESMDQIKNKSVKVAITSPPYWDLKDYFKEGQIGQEPYEEYIKRMRKVWKECYKKIADDGSLWININIRNKKGNVILIPYDIIRECKEIGFYYKGIIIWHKSSGIPTGDKNIVDRHEYVLIFSKSEDFAIDQDKLHTFTDYKNDIINGKAFWNINRKAGSVGKKFIHPAIYPNQLVSRIITLSSDPGDLILDPFLGSGTSLIAAMQTNRRFVGYEYNEGFKDLMVSRFITELGGIDNITFE